MILLNDQVLVGDQPMYAISGVETDTTNNRMELMGVLKGIEEVLTIAGDGTPFEIEVVSDSQYVVYGSSKWMKSWIMDGKFRQGKLTNFDLWNKMRGYIEQLGEKLKYTWTRGHDGDYYNEVCDKLAVDAYKQYKKQHNLA